MTHAVELSLVLALTFSGTAPDAGDDLAKTRQRVLAGYADFAHRLYAECSQNAREMRRAIRTLTEDPSEQTFRAARDAWLNARRIYGRTEVLRFYNGPIDNPRDGVETLLNAWPLDEAYIDAVAGHPDGGIINDARTYPNLSATLLTLLNERGGEANVAVGWHAVEFLLWGQDLNPEGPGARSFTDYVPGKGRSAARRAEYLRLCGDLLVQHHDFVRDAWSPVESGYRSAFVADAEKQSLRRVLAGMTILSGFEMAGERLAVAYETQDQEEEHSCFSDNTHIDFIANQEGILAVYHGESRGGAGPGVRAIAEQTDPELARELDTLLGASLEAIRAMPVPFDQAIRGSDDDPGRRAVLAALEALERQSEALASLALSLGFEIAIQPGG